MVCESEFSLHNSLPFFAHVDPLTELVGIFIEEEERKTSNELFLASSEYLDLELVLLVVIVKNFDWPPDIIFVFVNGRQSMRLVRPSLAEVDPLLNSLVFFPGVVTCQSLNTGKVRATIEYLILLLEYL